MSLPLRASHGRKQKLPLRASHGRKQKQHVVTVPGQPAAWLAAGPAGQG